MARFGRTSDRKILLMRRDSVCSIAWSGISLKCNGELCELILNRNRRLSAKLADPHVNWREDTTRRSNPDRSDRELETETRP
jgi:hypothetical protein